MQQAKSEGRGGLGGFACVSGGGQYEMSRDAKELRVSYMVIYRPKDLLGRDQ